MRNFFFLGISMLSCMACSQGPSNSDAGSDAASDVATSTDASSEASSDAGKDSSTCNITTKGTLVGTMLGKTLSVQDVVAVQSHTTTYDVVVGLTDYTGACAYGNDLKANSNVFAIVYSGATPLTTGTALDVTSTAGLDVQFAEYDATCSSPAGESSTAGTVTFTELDACGVAGTFDVTLNSDHVTGTFSAPSCATAPDGGASACK